MASGDLMTTEEAPVLSRRVIHHVAREVYRQRGHNGPGGWDRAPGVHTGPCDRYLSRAYPFRGCLMEWYAIWPDGSWEIQPARVNIAMRPEIVTGTSTPDTLLADLLAAIDGLPRPPRSHATVPASAVRVVRYVNSFTVSVAELEEARAAPNLADRMYADFVGRIEAVGGE